MDTELAKAIEAMELIVRWNEMTEYCTSRTDCLDCPYDLKKTCDLASTEFVLASAARTFKKFLHPDIQE